MAEQFSGKVEIRNASENTTIELEGETGNIINTNASGQEVFRIDGSEGDLIIQRVIDGVQREVLKFDSSAATLYIGASGNEGDLQIRDGSGRTVFNFDSNAAALYLGASGNEGDLQIRDGSGRTVFNFDSNFSVLRLGAAGNEGDLILKDNDGDETIHLDGGSGDIILRNADAAEHFDIADAVTVDPGMIMVLDEDGKLRPSSSPYDKKVVGVIAGAGEHRPGIIMDKRVDDDKRLPISLLGKVSCKVDATNAPIEIGDLLTTSQTIGHAMKATDPQKAFGSIIGKALSPLSEGIGSVSMLITLQ